MVLDPVAGTDQAVEVMMGLGVCPAQGGERCVVLGGGGLLCSCQGREAEKAEDEATQTCKKGSQEVG